MLPTRPHLHPRARRALLPLALLTGLASGCAREPARLPLPSSAVFPLDPLTADELTTAVAVLRRAGMLGRGQVLASIALDEPPKGEVLAFRAGMPLRRRARAVILDGPADRTIEAVVAVTGERILASRALPGRGAPITGWDQRRAERLLAGDPRWQAGLRRRGVAPADARVVLAVLGMPLAGEPVDSGRRVRATAYAGHASATLEARPLEGLRAIMSMAGDSVERIVDDSALPVPEAVPAPHGTTEDDGARAWPMERRDAGPRVGVSGSELRWGAWRFRVAAHPREGMVLSTVSFDDGSGARPVLYRASLSELVVPYGDPSPGWAFRHGFDLGEYGFGLGLYVLRPGVDVPRDAVFLDAAFAHGTGAVERRPRVIALYERDAGLLWRHLAGRRRGRELVIYSVVDAGNYDYGLAWVLREDGSIAEETELTGTMLARGVAGPGAVTPYGHQVGPHVVAVNHQHFFSFRLDLDVDGPDNRVVEVAAHGVPAGPANPAGNAIAMTERPLLRVRDAARDLAPGESRTWIVQSAVRHVAGGAPTGYALVPLTSAVPYAVPGSVVRRRAGFIEHAFWATRYDPAQRYAAGDYPNQGAGGGLPEWAASDGSLDGADVVVWYTLGVTHLPRPEDWPVMPVLRTGFQLVPVGFFTRSPALDAPPTPGDR